MGFSPMFRGQTGPTWTPTVTLDNGNPAPLMGATLFILYIRDVTGQYSERTGGGVVTINNGALGLISYAWGALDTSVVGDYMLKFQWTGVDGTIVFSDEVPWMVKQL